MIPLARPRLGDEEFAAVRAVLESGDLVQGRRVKQFEAALAAQTRRQFAVAVSSGTSAIQLALQAIEVGPGDEVLCPDLTWPSPAHAIRMLGAIPVLVDVDAQEWNAHPAALAAARTSRTRAAIVVDQFGFPARHDEIRAALQGVPIVEDAACALGSTVGGKPAGSFGEIACMSFHPRKVITTGEGGVCLTDDERLKERLRALRNHGQRSPGEFVTPSGNYRMTDLAAAVGLVQLDRLPTLAAERAEAATYYRARLTGFAYQAPAPASTPIVQTFGLVLPEDPGAPSRDQVIARLREAGVQAQRLSFALHRLPSVTASGPPGADSSRYPVAEQLDRQGLALPLFPSLTREHQDGVIDALHAAVGGAR